MLDDSQIGKAMVATLEDMAERFEDISSAHSPPSYRPPAGRCGLDKTRRTWSHHSPPPCVSAVGGTRRPEQQRKTWRDATSPKSALVAAPPPPVSHPGRTDKASRSRANSKDDKACKRVVARVAGAPPPISMPPETAESASSVSKVMATTMLSGSCPRKAVLQTSPRTLAGSASLSRVGSGHIPVTSYAPPKVLKAYVASDSSRHQAVLTQSKSSPNLGQPKMLVNVYKTSPQAVVCQLPVGAWAGGAASPTQRCRVQPPTAQQSNARAQSPTTFGGGRMRSPTPQLASAACASPTPLQSAQVRSPTPPRCTWSTTPLHGDGRMFSPPSQLGLISPRHPGSPMPLSRTYSARALGYGSAARVAPMALGPGPPRSRCLSPAPLTARASWTPPRSARSLTPVSSERSPRPERELAATTSWVPAAESSHPRTSSLCQNEVSFCGDVDIFMASAESNESEQEAVALLTGESSDQRGSRARETRRRDGSSSESLVKDSSCQTTSRDISPTSPSLSSLSDKDVTARVSPMAKAGFEQPRMLLRAIHWVFAAFGLPAPPLDPPTLCVLVRDFEMQQLDLDARWQDDPSPCAHCARHVCAALFELASGDRALVPAVAGQSLPVSMNTLGGQAPEEWIAAYASSTGDIAKILHSWDDEGQQRRVQRLFRKTGQGHAGRLHWRTGQIEHFARQLFKVFGLPALQCPTAVVYQLVRECDSTIAVSLDEAQAVDFGRHILSTVLDFNEAQSQGLEVEATSNTPRLDCAETDGEVWNDKDLQTIDYVRSLFNFMVSAQPLPNEQSTQCEVTTLPVLTTSEQASQCTAAAMPSPQTNEQASQCSGTAPATIQYPSQTIDELGIQCTALMLAPTSEPASPRTAEMQHCEVISSPERPTDASCQEHLQKQAALFQLIHADLAQEKLQSETSQEEPHPVPSRSLDPTFDSAALSREAQPAGAPIENGPTAPVKASVVQHIEACTGVSAQAQHTTKEAPADSGPDDANDFKALFEGVTLRSEATSSGDASSSTSFVLTSARQLLRTRPTCLPQSSTSLEAAPHEANELMRALARRRKATEGDGQGACLIAAPRNSTVTTDPVEPSKDIGSPNKVARVNMPLVASPCRNHSARQPSACSELMRPDFAPPSEVLAPADGVATPWNIISPSGHPTPLCSSSGSTDPTSARAKLQATVASEAFAADDQLWGAVGCKTIPSNDAASMEVAAMGEPIENDVPQLLAMVRATCISLADRLKASTPSRGGPGGASQSGAAEPAPPSEAIVAAAKAARDLLTEVEMAFLAGSLAASPSSGSTPTAHHLTQWFNMGTPISTPQAHTPNMQSLGNIPQTKSLMRHHRHSCPAVPMIPEDGVSKQALSPAGRGTPRNALGDWIYELRRVDPCPMLRPPHVFAPESPRPSVCAGSFVSSPPRGIAIMGDTPQWG